MDLAPVNPAEPRVIEIGRFAVAKHNENQPKKRVFVAVVGGFTGNVVGFKFYTLILETQEGNRATDVDKAFVLENPNGSLNLINYWE